MHCIFIHQLPQLHTQHEEYTILSRILDVDEILLRIGTKRTSRPHSRRRILVKYTFDSPVGKKSKTISIHTPTFRKNDERCENMVDECVEDTSDECFRRRHKRFEDEERRIYGYYDEAKYSSMGGIRGNKLKILFDKERNPLYAC